MSPRGRRPGSEDTRELIVDAARVEFAGQGYDGTSLRAVARRAGVDPALVHHYFEGKASLFAAIMQVPVDPSALIDGVLAGPRDEVGETLVRTFLTVWDSPEGQPRLVALVKSAVTHEDAAKLLREFLSREVFGRVTARLTPEGGIPGQASPELRAGLAGAQMVGLAMMRYVLRFPDVTDASADDIVQLVGPTIQRYLVP